MTPALEIRPLVAVEELEACVEMQATVWGFADRDLVPRRLFVVANKIGGQVLGAWDGERLAGFSLAIPGRRGPRPYWHSHMVAVGPEYRSLGLGRRIKMRQRAEALELKIELIEWTFDPLEIKNGHFNLAVLGAVARVYHSNLYGSTTSALQAGLPSDRLTAEWWLRSAEVTARAAGEPPPAISVLREVEVPSAVHEWKHAGDGRAAELQARNAATLQAAFQSGLAAVGYRRSASQGTFLLGEWAPPL